MRLILIACTLYAYWLLLSGKTEPWFVVSGAVIAVTIVVFCWIKGLTDGEGFPIGLVPRGLIYWPWLAVQIVRSALRVSRLILDPARPISPSLVKVSAEQVTSVGLVTYANSITLGTISVEASEKGRCIWVHALERDGAKAFQDDPINHKVAWFERGRA